MPRRTKTRLDEQKRLILSACVSGMLLLLALLLPLAFRDTGDGHSRREDPEDSEKALAPAERKAAMYLSYRAGDTEKYGAEAIEKPGKTTLSFCEERMQGLLDRWIDDRAPLETVADGSEYVLLRDGDTELRLCRMWRQLRGDWQNWIDAFFDADTGELYYLYVSRECLTNQRKYPVSARENPSGETLARELAEERSMRLRDYSGGLASLSGDQGNLSFEINCVYYDALIDVKIGCVSR